jgi:hypothetical protein
MARFSSTRSNEILDIIEKYFKDENQDNETINVVARDWDTIEIDYRRISNKKYSSSNRKVSVSFLDEFENKIIMDIIVTFLKHMREK